MQSQDQNKMFDVLAQQRQHQLLVDRVLESGVCLLWHFCSV